MSIEEARAKHREAARAADFHRSQYELARDQALDAQKAVAEWRRKTGHDRQPTFLTADSAFHQHEDGGVSIPDVPRREAPTPELIERLEQAAQKADKAEAKARDALDAAVVEGAPVPVNAPWVCGRPFKFNAVSYRLGDAVDPAAISATKWRYLTEARFILPNASSHPAEVSA